MGTVPYNVAGTTYYYSQYGSEVAAQQSNWYYSQLTIDATYIQSGNYTYERKIGTICHEFGHGMGLDEVTEDDYESGVDLHSYIMFYSTAYRSTGYPGAGEVQAVIDLYY